MQVQVGGSSQCKFVPVLSWVDEICESNMICLQDTPSGASVRKFNIGPFNFLPMVSKLKFSIQNNHM